MNLYSRKLLFPLRYKNSMSCFHQWIIVCVCVQCVTSFSGKFDKLIWNITSNPVKFGETARLSCFIPDYDQTCTYRLRQWIGGQQYSSLCQNTRCSDGTKYHVQVETPCTYTLMISNFSIYDVNCEYTCFYGIHSYRKHLQLNSKEFLSVPRIKHSNMTFTGGIIDIHVSIKDVYPSPQCHAILEGKNITNSLHVEISRKDFFYDVEFQVYHPKHLCHGNVTIYCYLGKEEIIVLNEYIDECSDIHTSDPTGNSNISIDIIVGAVVAVTVICIGIYFFWKNTKRNNDNEGFITIEQTFDSEILEAAHDDREHHFQSMPKTWVPVGPLSTSNKNISSADIDWQPPTMNCGAPLEKNQREYQLPNTLEAQLLTA